jgi:hypothetical protein
MQEEKYVQKFVVIKLHSDHKASDSGSPSALPRSGDSKSVRGADFHS